MVVLIKSRRATPTDLTLEEQHPFSYRFQNEIVSELRKAVGNKTFKSGKKSTTVRRTK